MHLFRSKQHNIISRAEKDLSDKCGTLSELYKEFKVNEQDPDFEQSEEKTQLMDEISNLNASISTAFTDLERELEQETGEGAENWDDKTKNKIERLRRKCGAAEKSMLQTRAYETLSDKYYELEVDSTEKIEELHKDYKKQIDLLFNKNREIELNCKESDEYKDLKEKYRADLTLVGSKVQSLNDKCKRSKFMCRGDRKKSLSDLNKLVIDLRNKLGGDEEWSAPGGGNGVQKLMGGSNKRKIRKSKIKSIKRRKSIKRKSTRKRLTKKKSSRKKLSRRR